MIEKYKKVDIQKLKDVLATDKICLQSIISEDKFYILQNLRSDRRRSYLWRLTEAHEMHAKIFVSNRVMKKITVDKLRNYLNSQL